MMNDNNIQQDNQPLYLHIAQLIEQSRQRIATIVNTAMVYTYYEIGRYIVEDEQQGNYRAEYGKAILKDVSKRLTERFGMGWSYRSLRSIKQFYIVYSKRINSDYPIWQTLFANSSKSNLANSVGQIQQFTLSWSHYLVLMRIEKPDERNFYEIECQKQNWSVRQLQRQYNSSLYERLALSRDKDEVMRLANEGQNLEKPSDIIKNPLTLEFLGLHEDQSFSESKLENAIISKMQKFLLEMGKGFLFEARQKRFTFNEDHFFVDLVFYNRLLRCYVLIDLKIDKLTHQDLGQMQMYVNYYDRYERQDYENPTIGILLCKEKDDALVELTLPEDANIYAQQYALYLPDKKLLQEKLQQWIEEEENNDNLKGE
jgi:predicted nuclease of restriction endonuclease-like (RecB) superfamily